MGYPLIDKPRVLHLGKFYPPHMGGIETHMQSLCQELSRDYRVEAVVANDGPFDEQCMDGSVSVRRTATRFRISSAPGCPGMVSIIRESKPRLVHLHLPNPLATVALLASGYRGPIVVTYHSDIVRQKLLSAVFSPVMNALFRRATSIICTSQLYLDSSPALQPFRAKCAVIPYGIPTTRMNCISAREVENLRGRFGKRVILAVGRLVYYKGFEFLIDAMRNINAKLVIVGEGPLRLALEKQIADLSLTDRVEMLGEIQNENLGPYYHAADAFVLPSIARSEAFGIVQLEAMASGLPVVNTDLDSGVPFVSRHNETGFTVPPKDSTALCSAINRLLNDPLLRARFGEAARRRVQNEFTLQTMAEKTTSLYREVFESAPVTRPATLRARAASAGAELTSVGRPS